MLTLTGSNFGALAVSSPLVHANFSADVNPSSFSQLTTWNENSNMAWSTLTSSLTGAMGVAYGFYQSSASATALHFRIKNPNPFQQIYHYSRRLLSNSTSANTKTWRLWRNGNGGPNDYVISTDQGGVCFNESETGDTPGINGQVGGYQGPIDLSTATWYNERFIWIRTGAGTGKDSDGGITTGDTGVWDYKQNGVTVQHRENVRNHEDLLTELVSGIFADAGHPLLDNTLAKFGSIYLSTVTNAVFLSTHSTWATSEFEMQPQPMTARSATSITFAVDRTGIDTAQQVYVYVMGVTTSDVNSNGFAANITAGTTNLHPALGTITQTSMAGSWDNVGTNQLAVFSVNSDFSSPISSGNATTPQTYNSLTCNTAYYLEVKVSTEADSGYTSTNATTNACSAATSAAKISIGGAKINGVIFK